MRLVAVADTSELRQRWKLMRHRIRGMQSDAVKAAGQTAVAHAKRTTVFKDRTGQLRRLINSSGVKFDGNEAFIWFSSPAPYSWYVEAGTDAHDIWPKAGHGARHKLRPGQSRRDITDIGTHRVALRWYVHGRPVFARMVHHPGTSPRPFMVPAAEYAGEWLRTFLERQFIGLRTIWD